MTRGEEPSRAPTWWQSLRVRVVLLAVALVLVPTGSVALITQHRVGEELASAERDVNQKKLQLVRDEVARHLGRLSSDALRTAEYPPVRGMLRALNNGGRDPHDDSTLQQWRTRLEQLFFSYARTRHDIRQIRYLDSRGMEWLRVDSDGTSPRVVPPQQLQDKSGRNYFRIGIALPAGQTHIATIDLNEEWGRVSVPHEPTLRVMAPVWHEGRVAGLIVINHSPTAWLKTLDSSDDGSLVLVKPNGTYMYHADETKCWGEQLGHGANLFRDWPQLTHQLDNPGGLVESDDEVMIWSRIDEPGQHEMWGVIAAQSPKTSFYRILKTEETTYGTVALTVALLAAFLAIVLSLFWVRPLSELSSAVTQISQGVFTTRVRLARSGELHQLGVSVNRMAEDLGNYTRHLEIKVQERTVELQRAKDAAEQASSAKSAFLTTMSHELRTPLNAIMGFCQILEGSPELGARQREQVSIIHRCSTHLLGLINQLLDMSTIEAGQAHYDTEEVELPTLLADVESMMSTKAAEKELSFDMQRAPELPHWVQLDALKTRQVLINLINNAIKFTTTGGIVVAVDFRADQGELRFSIRDSGPGIPAEQREAVFEPFTQLHPDRNERIGTGLGLAISRRYARGMGGDVRIVDSPAAGVTFEFVVPAGICPISKSERRSTTRLIASRVVSDTSALHILIVEDNALSAQVLREMLAYVGISTRTSENGERGLQEWQRLKPDLVFMDLHMPVMDGIEATRRIRERDARVPIIAVSASAEELAGVEDHGFSGKLTKPILAHELNALLSEHLGVEFAPEVGASPGGPLSTRSHGESLFADMAVEHSGLLDELRLALREVDPERIDGALTELTQLDPRMQQLLPLAREFRYGEILDMMRRATT